MAVKFLQSGPGTPAQLIQTGPLLQKIASPQGVGISRPGQGLREIAFQQAGDLVGQSGLLVDQLASRFAEQAQAAGVGVVGNPNAEALPMLLQQFQQERGIGGIILGATGIEGFAKLGQG